ncbi:MFS-type transporter involved in bile tolerance (Atg22 family) [Actinomycetospora succinea]|uniref:MFS-type transporter involved in bile tolerance (Atg22 family) n=1 Tax=Actinomycetospora succinea TaxID=663603 RepID=A0A4R6UYA1_9PSEU|nr:MFS transporter [Actinomycetospora succinea]TDQ50923.1 MFS-type transporter involved in bile tolerance (Atg22 family) [Actinomycetospora succinea]
MTEDDRPARFRDVLADPQFFALWVAQLLSVLGDQVARVALAVLVFTQTASAGLTALTYALTFLPDLVAGPLLSGIADRAPRRLTMVVSDLLRAAILALMAVPGVPFWALCLLVVAGQLIAAPFAAARAAILPHVLTGERYVVASAISGTTYQSGQVLGFALGGPLVALVGVPGALLGDAATFVLSAAILQFGVTEQRATGSSESVAALREGARIVLRDRRLRALVALACVSAFVVTIEGLAAPYAAALGGGPVAVGLLLAANPLGAALGIVVIARLVPPGRRDRLLGPLAIASCVPLIASALDPPLAGVVALWVLSGLACAYQVPANAAFVAAVPDAHRGQAFGLAVTALRVTQGLGVLLAGVLAEATEPAVAVAVAGGVGVLVAATCALAWSRARAG